MVGPEVLSALLSCHHDRYYGGKSVASHYYCKNVKLDFDVDSEKYGCGADLPIKYVLNAEPNMKKTVSTYLLKYFGFKGDKVPDIDLNFSGEYQPIAHKYTEELFGKVMCFVQAP